MTFPATRLSVIQGIRSDDSETRRLAWDLLVAAYWRAVYKYLRLRWRASDADAEDLTQGFFARAFEKDFFARYDAARARFRTYLRTCLDAFVANERAAASRLKRGGGAPVLSLDFAGAEGELRLQPVAEDADMEGYFHREWVRGVFTLAVETLRSECEGAGRAQRFELFARYDLEGPDAETRPTYASLAAASGLPVTQVTNQLAAARRDFRRVLLEVLRAHTASETEFHAEARELLGGRWP